MKDCSIGMRTQCVAFRTLQVACSDASFYRSETEAREEKCYFCGVEQKVAIVQVETGPQNLLDVFTSLVLPAVSLTGYAVGGISVFVFESR